MLVRRLTQRLPCLVRCKHDQKERKVRRSGKLPHPVETLTVDSSMVPKDQQKSVRVAFIGEPNSGKSTLINRYLDQNISSVTEHANTTNRNVVGVITDGDTQVVIIDTPGMPYYPGLKANKLKYLQEAYITPIQHAIHSVDLLVYIVDSTVQLSRNFLNTPFKAMIEEVYVPKLLVLNKLDCINERAKLKQLQKQYTTPLVPHPVIKPITERTDIKPALEMKLRFSDGMRFKNVFAVSALFGTNLEHLRQAIQDHATHREWEYDHQEVCPDSLEEVVCDMYREMLLQRHVGEMPHTVKHSVLYVREDVDKVVIGHQAESYFKIYKDPQDFNDFHEQMSKALSERFGISVELRLQTDKVDKSRPLEDGEEDAFC